MSDSIEFGIGGNNKAFVAVLADTEKKAKETSKRVSDNLDKVGAAGANGKPKIASDLNGIAGEFAKVKGASEAVELTFSKIGAGLKAGGAIALIASIGKGIYDAKESAIEFEISMSRIANLNRGGVSNFGLSDLESNLTTIRAKKEENKASMGFEGTAKDYAANLGNFLVTGKSKTTGEIANTRLDRDADLREEEQKALDRIAEKQKKIFDIERQRISGNKEGAEIMAIEAAYAEKIQAAISSRNIAEQKQLHAERDELIAAAQRRQGVAMAGRVSATGLAAMRAGDAERALGMSSEDEQRQANQTRQAAAVFAESDSQKAFSAQPNDPDLEAKYQIALRNTQQITAENAKWERDIARSKGDSVKSQTAQNNSLEFSLRGNTRMADLTRARAENELAITRALREGNTELAEQLRRQGELNEKAQFRSMLLGDNGRIKTGAQIRREQKRQQRKDAKINKAQDRFEKNDFLTGIDRDLSGRITGGHDLLTGKRVKVDKAGNKYNVRKDGSWEWLRGAGRGEGGRNALNEMGHRLGTANAKAASEKSANAKAESSGALDKNVGRLIQIMEAWNN